MRPEQNATISDDFVQRQTEGYYSYRKDDKKNYIRPRQSNKEYEQTNDDVFFYNNLCSQCHLKVVKSPNQTAHIQAHHGGTECEFCGYVWVSASQRFEVIHALNLQKLSKSRIIK